MCKGLAIGTDQQIFVKEEPTRKKVEGRPEFNRDLARRLLISGYSTNQIMASLKCSQKTVYRMKAELIAEGVLNAEEVKEAATPLTDADFDSECKRATGISFKEWLLSRMNRGTAISSFNFSSRVWDQTWKKPSLIQVKDSNNQLGGVLCQAFLKQFGEDLIRIRGRKKRIRNLFRFLGRSDLCDRFLTMSNARDPRNVRRLPVIELPDFPLKFIRALELMPEEYRLAIMFKIVTQIRTGSRVKDTGFYGLKKGNGNISYLIMDSPASYRCHVLEKMREEWDITHIPIDVATRLFELYNKTAEGDQVFGSINKQKLRRLWKAATLKEIGTEFTLHDLRKISITWFWVCGIPLEIAVSLNVGWKDLNTPKDHYLQLRSLLKKSQRVVYVNNIPAWFKEGLKEYMED